MAKTHIRYKRYDYSDMVGRRFGRLTVLAKDIADKSRPNYWLCKCDCGTELSIIGYSLMRGCSESCGCSKTEKAKPDSGAKELYWTYIRSARKRGVSFELTLDEFKTITSQNCHYCGATPHKTRTSRKGCSPYTYNGIDRMDNEVGYILSNCVPCCSFCNYKKRATPYMEFVNWIHTVSNTLASQLVYATKFEDLVWTPGEQHFGTTSRTHIS